MKFERRPFLASSGLLLNCFLKKNSELAADSLRSSAPKQVSLHVGKSELLKKGRLARENPDSLKSSALKQVRWFLNVFEKWWTTICNHSHKQVVSSWVVLFGEWSHHITLRLWDSLSLTDCFLFVNMFEQCLMFLQAVVQFLWSFFRLIKNFCLWSKYRVETPKPTTQPDTQEGAALHQAAHGQVLRVESAGCIVLPRQELQLFSWDRAILVQGQRSRWFRVRRQGHRGRQSASWPFHIVSQNDKIFWSIVFCVHIHVMMTKASSGQHGLCGVAKQLSLLARLPSNLRVDPCHVSSSWRSCAIACSTWADRGHSTGEAQEAVGRSSDERKARCDDTCVTYLRQGLLAAPGWQAKAHAPLSVCGGAGAWGDLLGKFDALHHRPNWTMQVDQGARHDRIWCWHTSRSCGQVRTAAKLKIWGF